MSPRLALLAVLGALLIPATASAATEEVQGWRNANDHIHTSFPGWQLQTLSSPSNLAVTTLLHNRAGGHLTFVRWSWESSVQQSVSYNVTGTGASEQIIGPTNLTVTPATAPNSGWRELRVTSNFVTSTGLREFTTTRTCVFVNNGKSRSDYCGGPTTAGRCGGGAWYQDINYRIATVDCRDVYFVQNNVVPPGYTFRVKFQDGPGFANLDPAFHVGNPGVVLGTNMPANTWTTVQIPLGTSTGVHKLHLRAMGSATNPEAGAYVLSIYVG